MHDASQVRHALRHRHAVCGVNRPSAWHILSEPAKSMVSLGQGARARVGTTKWRTPAACVTAGGGRKYGSNQAEYVNQTVRKGCGRFPAQSDLDHPRTAFAGALVVCSAFRLCLRHSSPGLLHRRAMGCDVRLLRFVKDLVYLNQDVSMLFRGTTPAAMRQPKSRQARTPSPARAPAVCGEGGPLAPSVAGHHPAHTRLRGGAIAQGHERPTWTVRMDHRRAIWAGAQQ